MVIILETHLPLNSRLFMGIYATSAKTYSISLQWILELNVRLPDLKGRNPSEYLSGRSSNSKYYSYNMHTLTWERMHIPVQTRKGDNHQLQNCGMGRDMLVTKRKLKPILGYENNSITQL